MVVLSLHTSEPSGHKTEFATVIDFFICKCIFVREMACNCTSQLSLSKVATEFTGTLADEFAYIANTRVLFLPRIESFMEKHNDSFSFLFHMKISA